MSYFLRTTSETQKRLNAVLNKRKEDEEKLRPVSPVGGAGDSVNINAPTNFGDSLPDMDRILSGEQAVQPTYANQYRRFATREWIVPPGIIKPDHPGVPRPTDAQVADEPGAAEREFRSQGNIPEAPVDMQKLKIAAPFEYQKLAEDLGLATAETAEGEMPKVLAPAERYGELSVIQSTNVAGNDPALLTAGVHDTPDGQVPIVPGHPHTVVLTPEEADSAVLIEQLDASSPPGTLVRVEGESRFGTLSAGEAFMGMGEVMLGFMDVAMAPFEAFAETGFQLTHTLPQNTTLFQEGFGATVERSRGRSLLAQIAIGVVFDPFVIGKLLKIPVGVTRAVASRYVRQAIDATPNLSDAQKSAIHDQVLDKVVDRSGYTIDSDMRRWWSPAQQAWVDVSDQAANVREFGVPLIAGGAQAPGERLVNPFPGGQYSVGKRPRPVSTVIRDEARKLGIDDEELRSIQNQGGRITVGRLQRFANDRNNEIAGNVINRTDEEVISRNVTMDGDAAVSGMGESYSNPFDPAYPDARSTSPALTATAELNPNLSRTAEETAAFNSQSTATRSRSRHAERKVEGPTIGARVSKAKLGFQSAFVDRTALTNELQDRVAKDILTETNIWRVQNGFEPLYRLPDGMRANVAFALNMGGYAAAEDATRLSLSKIYKKLGNKFRDRGSDNIDTLVLNDYVSMLHHLDVLRIMKKRDLAAGGLGVTARRGMNQMTEFDMLEDIALTKREYTEGFTPSASRPKSKWDRLVEASKEIYAHYDGLRNMMVSEGLMSRQLADELATNYPHYNPIKYVEGTIMPYAKTIITRAKNRPMLGIDEDDVIKELSAKGLDKDQQLPLMLLESSTSEVYRKAGENRFTSSLIELARNDRTLPPGTVKQIVTLGEGQTMADLLPYQLSSATQNQDWDMARTGLTRVARMVNGEREIWEIPTEMAEQLKLLDPISPGLGERIARMINKPMRMAFTSHNPVFMAANFLHDMMIVVMNEGVLPHEVVTSLAATLSDVWKRDSVLHALVQSGGDVGGLSGKLGDDIRAQAMRSADRANMGADTVFNSHSDWLSYVRKIGEPLNYLSRAIEMAPRRAVFKKTLTREEALRQPEMGARRQFTVQQQPVGTSGYTANVFNPSDFDTGGKVKIGGRGLEQETTLKAFGRVFDEPMEYSQESVRSAAYAARNATVDFQKYGSAIKMFDALFLYTNAAIQGTLLPARALRRGGYRMTAPGVGFRQKTPGAMGGIAQRVGQNKAKVGTLGFMGAALTLYAHNALRYPDAFQNMSLQDKLTRFAVIHGEEEDQYGNKVAKTWSLQPLLREYAALNASVVMTMDKLFERDSATATQFLTTLIPNINPAGTVVNFGGRDATFGLQTLPTPTTPLQIFNDYRSNWDSFRNAPIVSPELASRPVEQQYDAYTTDLAKGMGSFLGLSPKKLDNAMRVGAFRDVFSIIDLGLKRLNPDEPDPEISGLAAELSTRLEIAPVTEHAVERNEFFKNLTSQQRREVEIVMDAEPTGIPFVTTLQNRFNRESGGQKRRTGVFVAAKAFDVSAQETSDMAQLLGRYMDLAHDTQLEQDQLYRDGKIDAKQWIQGDREQGTEYAGAFLMATLSHPKAAQAMLDENGNARDPKKWSDYKEMVATARGWWKDTRTEGQILAAQRRGIPMPIDADGQPDYHTYFQHLEEFEADVRDEYNQKGVDMMNRELKSVMTDIQTEHYDEVGMGGQGGLRQYWDIAGDVADRTRGPAGEIYRRFLDANNDERLYLKQRYSGYISAVQRIVNRQREIFRRRNPGMDALYVKWGYAEAGQTRQGRQAARERVERGRESLAYPGSL